MRARLAVRVSPADVGQRVTVRAATPDGPSDTVGWLRRWDEGTLEIERRDGERVHVAEDAVLAARVVPS